MLLNAANAVLGNTSFAIPNVDGSGGAPSNEAGFSSNQFSGGKNSKTIANHTTVNFDFKRYNSHS